MCFIENKLFRLGPINRNSLSTSSRTNSKVLVSYLLDIGTFVNVCGTFCSFTVLTLRDSTIYLGSPTRSSPRRWRRKITKDTVYPRFFFRSAHFETGIPVSKCVDRKKCRKMARGFGVLLTGVQNGCMYRLKGLGIEILLRIWGGTEQTVLRLPPEYWVPICFNIILKHNCKNTIF